MMHYRILIDGTDRMMTDVYQGALNWLENKLKEIAKERDTSGHKSKAWDYLRAAKRVSCYTQSCEFTISMDNHVYELKAKSS
jgi:hypothetical protein|tara:strand:- start:5420 stop:5665 length:246 start_codon:yes stop_codon:yes gene_type:complete